MKYRWPIVREQTRRGIRLSLLFSTTLVAPLVVWPPLSLTAAAQTVASHESHPPPPYTPQVWDIDWQYLANPANRQDWTDDLHYIHLGSGEGQYLSLNGQIRERGEYQDHPAFGAQPSDNGYFLQRYLSSADLHLGSRFRTFFQLDSGLISGRDGGPRPGIDEDKFDVNQGFIDIVPYRHGDDQLTVRSGRQLISLGSTRLVAIGAGLNVEQPFDGFRLTLHQSGWTADGIAVRPVSIGTGVLDNEPNSREELWGINLTHPVPHLKSTFVDLLYLGFDHKQARYTQGTGREQRETIGGRIWSHTSTWDYDFEYTGQFGRFGTGNIRAWGTGYHLGYTFTKSKFAPHPEIDGGVLSGDNNPHDNTLHTFNPLFPNGNYLNESILLGPYNLIIVRPTMKYTFNRKLSSNTNVEMLWRQSTQDGVYNIVGILTHPPAGSSASFIGSQIQEVIDYSFSRHWSGSLAYEHFFAGQFLKQSPPGKSVNFISPQLMWNF
jgi:hypothetical protein